MAMDLIDAAGRRADERRQHVDAEAQLSLVEAMLGSMSELAERITEMMEKVFEAGKRLDPKWHEICPDGASGWERYDVEILGDGVHVEWRDYDQWGSYHSTDMHLTAEDLADPEAGARRQRQLYDDEQRAIVARGLAEKEARRIAAEEQRRKEYEALKAEFERVDR